MYIVQVTTRSCYLLNSSRFGERAACALWGRHNEVYKNSEEETLDAL